MLWLGRGRTDMADERVREWVDNKAVRNLISGCFILPAEVVGWTVRFC